MMDTLAVTGRTDRHLIPLETGHRLQPLAATAFARLQQAATQAGFSLRPASSFRDFDRQLLIWNGKFHGQRPLLDHFSRPLEALSLATGPRCEAILRWSALPGASRHHWGTDLDIFDPDLLPPGAQLQLTPEEYLPGGCFASLTRWLDRHLGEYGFYRPYARDRGGVAVEPWHISYRPLADRDALLLTPAVLLEAWQGQDVAGSGWLAPRLDDIFQRYIDNIDKE
ncbi:M15 family metallopeptidase [Sodalis sp. (in: enterobacteria)]|uniref:M15 family metallopeptidase n=1 Tax=Sodalis sp. (in: enterobacteria) TaxID=1898979 RepID=UPI003F3C4249